MTSHRHAPPNPRPMGQADLDFQPVREARVRVLNNIPKEPCVPPHPPLVKFNFVDVSFSKPPERESEATQGHQGNVTHGSKKRSNAPRKERSARNQVQYDKENSYDSPAQRNLARDRGEYLTRLLRRGVPVWEEVPEEERAAKVIGGTNPFRHHPYSSNPLTSYITHRNTNKPKSNTIGAAWEDVEDGFKNSYPLDHADDLIDSPRGSASEAEEESLKRKAERLNNILRKNNHIASNAACDTLLYNRAENLSGHKDHEGGQVMPSDVHRKVFKPGLRTTTLTRELHTGEATEAAPSTRQEQIPEHSKDSSSSQGLLHQDVPDNVGCQEMVPPVPGGRLPHQDENTHQDEDLDQERTLRTAMKKINARQIDNNGNSSISWWQGDKLYKERTNNEEEEKHEKESTKEKNGKRDLSAPSADSQKNTFVLAGEEEVEEVVKSPLRMRHYEVDEVRKYMRGKQSERAKGLKEQQRRQEQEKVQRNERMKELAIKTKQLSQAGKKGSCDAMADALLHQDQDQLDQQPLIDWGGHGAWGPEAEAHPGPSSANHVNTQLKDQSLSPGASRMPSSTRAGKSPKKSETKMDISKADVPQNSALNEEKRHGEVNAKKRSKKDSKKRRKRRSASDSEAISDIVSRTVEECERQVKASSISMESLSSFSSFSCSSSDAESRSSQSESLSSGLDLAPTERAVALGQLAKKLTNQVTQETSHLTQQEKQSPDVANTPHRAARTSVEKQATKRVRDKSPNTKSDPRASLSFSQIEKMSVDELIAKMTAMLPNKTLNEGWSNAPHTDLQGLKRNAYENQKFDFSTHNQNRTENATDKHIQDIPVKEDLQTMLTEQLPKLVAPNVPNLELSCGDKRPKDPNEIAPRENLSTLPGHTIVPGVKDSRTIVPGVKDGRTIVPGVKDGHTIVPGVKDLKSQTDEEKQVYVKMTPSHKVRHKYVVSHSDNHLSGRQPGQSQGVYNVSNKDLNTSCEKFEYAATVIQAAYRGFRVRKITSLLVNGQPARKRKDTNEIRSLRRAPTGAPASVEPRSYRFFRDSDTVIEGNGDQRQEMLSKEVREQVNWREIQSELESRTLRPRKESYYISQTSDLPGWIKPYFVLSETGDVRNFLETQADKPDSGAGEEAEYESRSRLVQPKMGGRGSQHFPHTASVKPTHNVTLTEGLLSDLENDPESCYDKETQTSYNRYVNIEQKGEFDQDKDTVGDSEAGEFINLKKFSKRKFLSSQNGESIINIQQAKSSEIFASGASDATGTSQPDHENTLEEGLLEETVTGEDSFQAENETLESGSIEPHLITEKEPRVETSGITDSSDSNTSHLVEKVFAPHELSGEGVHLGPASLRLRLNAELMYQDTLGKALNQLHNVEQLNILNRSRQEAMALSQSLALQQQKVEFSAQWKSANEMNMEEKEAERRDDYERRLKEKLKQQDEALQKVEKIEKEARSRFAELEREVRSRAEKMIAQATERVPQPSSAQSDVIAAAAVAAVGATISQWKQLRPMQDSRGSVILTEGQASLKSGSNQNYAFSSRLFSEESRPGTHSVTSLSRDNKSTGDKTSSVSENVSESLLKSSVIEELPSSKSASKNLVELEMNSHRKSTSQGSVPESIASMGVSVPTANQSRSASASSTRRSDLTQSHSNSVPLGDREVSSNESECTSSISEKIGSLPHTQTKVSSDEVMSASNLVSEDVLYSKTSGSVIEAISKNSILSGTRSSEVDTSFSKPHSPTQKGSIKDLKKHHMKEPLPSKKIHGSFLMSSLSKSREKEKKKEEKDTSDAYSDSFEVDSENENSNTLSSEFQGRSQGAYGGDLALVVSSGNLFNDMGYRSSAQGVGGGAASVHGSGGDSALGVTLSVVESLLKEEEVHQQHQKALLKLQEQSLIEEAKWKLAALQSEGGPGVRRRQRVVLQLREQKAYLKRLRETQNIGAQHSKLMLLQLHNLLGTTTSMSGFSTKGSLTTPRGHSPNPSSPRLTPRLMEMHSSSSSDAPEDVHLNVPMRGRDKDSSSPSESGGGREKRRSHSDDRQKLGSGRLHEKRRTAEAETLQQLLLYDDKEGRLKTKSPYDAHDKDSVKPKRKGDFITKRSREKKEKSSGSVSPHSFHKQGSRTSTESSVPTESVVATTHDSQSSIPEEVGSETISRSDVTSSVSEQEGLTVTSHRTGSSQAKDGSSGSKKLASCVVSEKEASHSLTPKPKMITSDSETIQEAPYIHSDKDSKNNEKSSSVKTASNGEISVSEERFGYDRSERNSRSSEKSSAANSEVSEKISISQESSIRTKYSSESIKSRRNKSEPLIPEDITENSNVRTTPNSSWFSTETGGARSSDSKSVEGKSLSQNSSTRGLPLPLKVPLSPRSPHRQHRRYSSESDDSFTLSQTETASDMSDGEGRLLALKEELATRRAEADRLKKEKRRLRRERLASQERALRQQISTYDAYIQHARMELEKESKELKQASMVRPLIKKPQVAETKKSRLSESLATSPEKSDISDVSLVSEGAKSDYSGLSKSLDMNLKEIHHGKPHEVVKSKELTTKHIGAGSSKEPITSPYLSEVETNEQSSSSKKETTETSESQRENESEKTSLASSVSENLNEESVSEHTDDDVSSKKSISQGSSVGTDPTLSQASSTQTIVHSPQKLDLSQKDVAVISMNEVSAALLEVLKDNVSISKSGESDPVIIAESEKKLEIFIPTSGLKSSEAEDLVEGSTNTSAEQSMGEEVCEDLFEEVESEGVSQETEASKSGLVPLTLIEVEAHEKIDTSHSSSLTETEPLTDIETPTIHTPEIKKTPEKASKKHSPTPDRQRLVDDISNNILAVMMKDTSLLFTNIMKNKVNVSKVSVEEDYDEAVRDSTAPKPSGEASEPQEDAGSQSQHSRLLVRDDEFSIAEPSSGSKSQIVQRVNELICESGSGSLRLSSIRSPSSRDVQLSPHMTVDLNPESSSPVPLTTENTSEVERGGEELCQGDASLVAGEITSPGKEEEHSSLSPSHDVVKAEDYKLDTETLTNRLLNLASAPEVDLEAWLGHVGESNEFSVEGIEGNWVDDNFWTSSDNKKKQQQLKAEEERITAEIARLEELQHLQQKYPGLVIREVPNKPPPPYTPPQVTSPPSPASSPTPARPPAYSSPPTSPVLLEAQPKSPTHSASVSHRLSKADQRRLAAHVTQLVPITEEEALPIIDSALDVLSEAWQNNIDPGDISPPPHTTLADVFSLSSFSEEDMHEDEKTSTRAFHLLLFCLGRELLSVPYKLLHAALPPPWMKQALPQGCIRGRGLTQSQGKLYSMVREQVKVLFGWKPPLQKESLMIRWAQKHRDLVDQVLVKELQAEEASWTNYDEDEAAVKTKVASDILDTLVSETVTLMSSILFRKLGYIAH